MSAQLVLNVEPVRGGTALACGHARSPSACERDAGHGRLWCWQCHDWRKVA